MNREDFSVLECSLFWMVRERQGRRGGGGGGGGERDRKVDEVKGNEVEESKSGGSKSSDEGT